MPPPDVPLLADDPELRTEALLVDSMPTMSEKLIADVVCTPEPTASPFAASPSTPSLSALI